MKGTIGTNPALHAMSGKEEVMPSKDRNSQRKPTRTKRWPAAIGKVELMPNGHLRILDGELAREVDRVWKSQIKKPNPVDPRRRGICVEWEHGHEEHKVNSLCEC